MRRDVIWGVLIASGLMKHSKMDCDLNKNRQKPIT